MPPPTLSPTESDIAHRELIDNQKRPSDTTELRQNIAQLKLGEECLRRKRLLGAGNPDFETYSLPVSRVCGIPSQSSRGLKIRLINTLVASFWYRC